MTKDLVLHLKVKANAKLNKFNGYVRIGGIDYLKLLINTAPEYGKANDAMIKFIAKALKIPQSDIKVTRGHTNSLKTLVIQNINPQNLKNTLHHHLQASRK